MNVEINFTNELLLVFLHVVVVGYCRCWIAFSTQQCNRIEENKNNTYTHTHWMTMTTLTIIIIIMIITMTIMIMTRRRRLLLDKMDLDGWIWMSCCSHLRSVFLFYLFLTITWRVLLLTCKKPKFKITTKQKPKNKFN